jgi:F-type H+-transporting ATPase subunit delta
MAVQLRAASRESLAETQQRLDDRIDQAEAGELRTLGEQLFAVTRLLDGEPGLRRHLADSSVPGENRRQLAERLLGRQLDRAAMQTVSDLVSGRWSRPVDLVDAFEVLARRATLGVAEKDGSLSDVEDELFRFGRILNREPRLAALLSDESTPEDGRVGLLDRLLDDKARPVTRELLGQAVRSPRGRNLDVIAEELSELAADRRDRYVAHVATPVALSEEQERRLTDSLSRMYGREMSLQIELEPELVGGLVIRVGGEIIDGSIASRIAAAKRSLPK